MHNIPTDPCQEVIDIDRNTSECGLWREYRHAAELPANVRRSSGTLRARRFYAGDQWYEYRGAELPKPVFNVLRRVTDYRASALIGDGYTVSAGGGEVPGGNEIVSLVPQLAGDAALSGFGAVYVWREGGGIRAVTLDPLSVVCAEPDITDIDAQPFVMLAFRRPADELRRAASLYGSSGFAIEPDGDGSLAVSVTKLYRDGGDIRFAEFTRFGVIRRGICRTKRYPVAVVRWPCGRAGFYGVPPADQLIPNQKYLNMAWAMAMKHMSDTAFSKIIYDRSMIPEWTNEIGQAVGVSGGDITRAAAAVGVGQMQDGYLDLISRAAEETKSLSGATEAALGEGEADNVSAILALRQASERSLSRARAGMAAALARAASLAVEMAGGGGCGAAECGAVSLDPAAEAAELRRLYERGDITAAAYVSLMPDGVFGDREKVAAACGKTKDGIIRGERSDANG